MDLLTRDGAVWTYSDFEAHTAGYVSPSMYNVMAQFVEDAIDTDEYEDHITEEKAVEYYFSLPKEERLTMSEQELKNLENMIITPRSKITELNKILNYIEVTNIIKRDMELLLRKYTKEVKELERMINEESNLFVPRF